MDKHFLLMASSSEKSLLKLMGIVPMEELIRLHIKKKLDGIRIKKVNLLKTH